MAKNQERILHVFTLSSVSDDSGKTVTEEVTIKLSYHIGGMNYFNYKEEKRGLYLHIAPETVTKQEGSPFQTRQYTGYSGYKSLVKELKRFSAKTLNTCQVDSNTLENMIKHIARSQGIDIAKLPMADIDPDFLQTSKAA